MNHDQESSLENESPMVLYRAGMDFLSSILSPYGGLVIMKPYFPVLASFFTSLASKCILSETPASFAF